MSQPDGSAPEIWGGVECTVRRVGDDYFDQLERSGHHHRLDDLDRFADLGLRALRYPVLWERTAPRGLDQADWSWPDVRLARLRTLGIRPIVGLLHHGSGPPNTSLVDEQFPEQLAEYAGAVAARYPWLEDFTPVNEPLTTARFSGLYGHWYPHGHEPRVFARALVQQCRATVLAMRQIRQHIPHARLIQTEDLAKVHSTPTLRYQAQFENERRWLSFDLLTGRLTADRPLYAYLLKAGIPDRELRWFLDNPAPPDILGLNYYITSERYLDEHWTRFPPRARGGNGRHVYADLEAARGRPEGIDGLTVLLDEVWTRYSLPMAVTEAHLGCHRESQLRWLQEIWQAVRDLRQRGRDVRAVTIWSLLGAYDWNSLLTRLNGFYECGAFDLRTTPPRPTLVSRMIRALADGQPLEHPLLQQPGWWHTPHRWPAEHPARVAAAAELTRDISGSQPILVTGAGGTLGSAVLRLARERGLPCVPLTRAQLDIADPEAVRTLLSRCAPLAVVNAAGYVRVDDAETDPAACFAANVQGPANLAAACAERGVPLLTFSSDLVFGGRARSPYTEDRRCAPLNSYGRSKAEAEQLVLARHPGALIVRTSAFFGPWDEYNFAWQVLAALRAGRPFAALHDVVISPTYVPDLVHACFDLLLDGETGIWHLANQGSLTWREFAQQIAHRAGLDPQLVSGISLRAARLPAKRPRFCPLVSARGNLLPAFDAALDRYLEALAANTVDRLSANKHAS